VNGEDLLKLAYFIGREVRKVLDACSLKESGHSSGSVSELLGLQKKGSRRSRRS